MVNAPYRILGLDIGIGSCGWAILDTSNHEIVDLGVRLWDPPQEPKTKTSTAATRRNARSSRRNTKRTADRKKHCLKLLSFEGLVPQDVDAKWLQTKASEKPTLKLRINGLDRMLNDREWAQVLYSLCGHRGYIEHGTGSDDEEGKKVLGAIEKNKKIMEETGWRTIGEMLAHEPRSRNRGGDYTNCVSNQQLTDEITKLFFAQKQYGNKHADENFLNEYLGCMKWQKDVTGHDAKVYESVGFCSYFPDEKRAANACLSTELCKAYEKIGHTTIVYSDGTEGSIPFEQRQYAIEILFSPIKIKGNSECKVRYSDLRAWLDLGADTSFKGIERDRENKEEPFKPTCWRNERKVLPESLLRRMRDDRHFADRVDSALAYSSSRVSLEQQLKELPLSDEEIESICDLNYTSRAFSGYGSRSLKALDLLLDAFIGEEQITTLTQAEDACGLLEFRLRGGNIRGTRLPPYSVFDPTNNNPVVLRVMGQVRKIVNAISEEYGVPDEIHIELARNLKRSKKEKEDILKNNRQTKDARDAILSKLAEELHCSEEEVPLRTLSKVELWNEQNGFDLYVDQPIVYENLIKDDSYCQIDHILPYSRTCDDSRMNKILVLQKSNQDKKEQTPYEWRTGIGDWEEFKTRIQRLEHYPYKKKQRLLNTDLADRESEFINRNINDTRYASRAAKNYIETFLIFPENERNRHVLAVAGGATAALRNAWQIRKVREEDSLHHALDAAVIAACDESAVIAIARASEKKYYTPRDKRSELFQRTEPWENFSKELLRKKASLIPTHMVEHKISGRMFEDTLYQYKGLNEGRTKAILSAKGTEKVSSNYVLVGNHTAEIVDGLAFLRLWWDPEMKVRGRKDQLGGYLAEPVYYADFANILNNSYIPLIAPPQTSKKPRCDWSPLPEHLRSQTPVVLFTNDAVCINGNLRRFKGFGINTDAWLLSDPQGNLNFGEATRGLPISIIGPDTDFRIIQEDPLGHCYRDLQQ